MKFKLVVMAFSMALFAVVFLPWTVFARDNIFLGDLLNSSKKLGEMSRELLFIEEEFLEVDRVEKSLPQSCIINDAYSAVSYIRELSSMDSLLIRLLPTMKDKYIATFTKYLAKRLQSTHIALNRAINRMQLVQGNTQNNDAKILVGKGMTSMRDLSKVYDNCIEDMKKLVASQ